MAVSEGRFNYFTLRGGTTIGGRSTFGEGSLRNAVREYVTHYHAERNHQGVVNQSLEPDEDVGRAAGELQQRERLGGMLRYYYRDAA